MKAAPVPNDRTLRVETIKKNHAAWIVIHGEADISNLERLGSALAHVHLDGVDTVHIHMYDLDFVDGESLYWLTTYANQLKQTGRTVWTCGARPIVHRMARVLCIEDQLGLP